MTNADMPPVGMEHLGSGKVRESYALDSDHLLFVTTDRLSAFDVILNEPIPNKGRVLSAMTSFWFDELVDIVPSQVAEVDPSKLPNELNNNYFLGRTAIVHRAEMLPIECVVRGHLTGSAWKEYKVNGTVHKMTAPNGMRESEKFPDHMYTPSTKAESGHDENISFDESVDLVGGETAERLRELSLSIFSPMYDRAAVSGMTLADTKFEFGRLGEDLIILCDEVGTSDSSRYWQTDQVIVGKTAPSFDKQYVRDYLESTGWDKNPPPPPLPGEVVAVTAQKYQEAYERVTGLRLYDWPGIHKLPGDLNY